MLHDALPMLNGYRSMQIYERLVKSEVTKITKSPIAWR